MMRASDLIVDTGDFIAFEVVQAVRLSGPGLGGDAQFRELAIFSG